MLRVRWALPVGAGSFARLCCVYWLTILTMMMTCRPAHTVDGVPSGCLGRIEMCSSSG